MNLRLKCSCGAEIELRDGTHWEYGKELSPGERETVEKFQEDHKICIAAKVQGELSGPGVAILEKTK